MWKISVLLALAGLSSVCQAADNREGRLVALSRTEISDATPTVIQNRFFTKKLRAETGASFGTVLNESYSQTKTVGGALDSSSLKRLELNTTLHNFVPMTPPI